MKKIISLFALITFISCGTNNSNTIEEDQSQHQIENEFLAKTFFQVDSLLKIDNGNFWDYPLYGPIIFIDPDTRAFVANRNNLTHDFTKVNEVYLDTLPNELIIANTAINWNDERWTMVMLPLPTDMTARNNLIIHELFHRIQPEIGFGDLQEFSNGHLDTYEGRVLLKLELEALKLALNTDDENLRMEHLENALYFRDQRYSDDEKKNAENNLELNEGLAEYTAIMLSGRNDKAMRLHLTQSIDQFYFNPTYVRSFAYQTIPVYGYLLSKTNNVWQRDISKNTNLTNYFMEAFSIQIPNNTTYVDLAIANDYHYENIVEIEKAREEQRLVKIEGFKKKFLEEPTLTLYFENMNISFDSRNITPLEEFGTVYPNLRVTDNWGILTVENGALLSANWGSVLVSAPTDISANLVKGDGWTLALSKDWEVKSTDKQFELIKK